MNNIFSKTYVAGDSIAMYRIVKLTDEQTVALATASTTKNIGVANIPANAVVGDRVDVQMNGVADVEAGATFAAGDWLTSDGSGRAIVTADVAGTNYNVIGRALDAGAVGEIVPVLLSIGRVQG